MLKEFPQLAERIDHPGGALSGGEQQMLAIGRALMANPELILMDEPSEGLSPRLVQQVQEIMRRLRDARPRDPAGRAEPAARAVGRRRCLRALVGALRVSGNARRAGRSRPQILDQHLGVSGVKTDLNRHGQRSDGNADASHPRADTSHRALGLSSMPKSRRA